MQPAPRGAAAQRDALRPRPEWRCALCGTTNWEDRACCRSCGKKKGAKKEQPGGDRSSNGNGSGNGTNSGKDGKGTDVTEDTEKLKARPKAPEVRAAEAETQAAALEGSAVALRQAGLTEKAAELAAEAAQLRKQVALPLPGRRLDLLRGFVERCVKRAAKSAAAVDAAEAALEEAKKDRDEANKELEKAEEQLAQLTKELGSGAEEPGAKRGRWGDLSKDPAEELRLTQQRLAEEQRQHEDLQKRTALPAELRDLAPEALRQRLEATAQTYAAAVAAGRWEEATGLSLEQGHLTAALRDAALADREAHEHWRGP